MGRFLVVKLVGICGATMAGIGASPSFDGWLFGMLLAIAACFALDAAVILRRGDLPDVEGWLAAVVVVVLAVLGWGSAWILEPNARGADAIVGTWYWGDFDIPHVLQFRENGRYTMGVDCGPQEFFDRAAPRGLEQRYHWRDGRLFVVDTRGEESADTVAFVGPDVMYYDGLRYFRVTPQRPGPPQVLVWLTPSRPSGLPRLPRLLRRLLAVAGGSLVLASLVLAWAVAARKCEGSSSGGPSGYPQA